MEWVGRVSGDEPLLRLALGYFAPTDPRKKEKGGGEAVSSFTDQTDKNGLAHFNPPRDAVRALPRHESDHPSSSIG